MKRLFGLRWLASRLLAENRCVPPVQVPGLWPNGVLRVIECGGDDAEMAGMG